MKPTNLKTEKSTNKPFNHITCRIFGHKYRITKRYESNIKEFECAHCKKQYTLDAYGNYTPLTDKLKSINEMYENFYVKKFSHFS